MLRALTIVVVALVWPGPPAAAQDQPQPAPATLTHVQGGLYRVDASGQTAIVLVTGDGMLLVDPLNAVVAAWLAPELARRFPDVPIRYIVYSQYRFDRSSAGWQFVPRVEIVAHAAFREQQRRSMARLPRQLAVFDLNANGQLDPDEWSRAPEGWALATYDRNGDGTITTSELQSHIVPPHATYHTSRTIVLGGSTVALIHAPTSEAPDATVVHFTSEGVVFASDALALGELPSSIGRAPQRTIAAARRIEALEFDTILTAAGREGTKADVAVFRQYMVALTSAVRAGFSAGRSVDELAATLTLDRFAALSSDATRRESNIAEVYGTIRPVTFRAHATVQVNARQLQPAACPRFYTRCDVTSEWPASGGGVGFTLNIGRLVASAETAIGWSANQRFQLRDSQPVERIVEYHEVVQSFLVGYEVARRRGWRVSVEGGPSLVSIRGGVTEFRVNRTSFSAWEKTAVGMALGTSVTAPIWGPVAAVVPVRLTVAERMCEWSDSCPINVGRTTLTAGAGLSVNLARSGW